MDVDSIRRALREESSPSLRRRRRIAALAALGLVDFAVISLYQTGVLRRLPDLPGRLFDSNRVNASRKAYATGVPDGTLGALLYAGNLVLAAAGGTRASGRHAALDLLLGASVAGGVLGALNYLWDMARHQQRACPYCLLGGAAHFAMVPLVAPEVASALRELRDGSRRQQP